MALERERQSAGRNAVTPAAEHPQSAALAPVPEKERAESAPPAVTQPGTGGEGSRSGADPSPAHAPHDPRLPAAAKDDDDFWNDTGPKVDSPTQKEPEADGFIRRSGRKLPPRRAHRAPMFSSARPAELDVSLWWLGRYYLTDEMYDAIEMPEGRNQFLKHFDVDMPKEMVCSFRCAMRQVPCAVVTLLRASSERLGGLAGEGRRLESRSILAILLLRFPGLQTAPEFVRATARCVEGQAKGFQETI